MAKKQATKTAARNSRETILANIAESNERLDAHLQQFTLNPPTDDSRLTALGYWVAYPLLKKTLVDSHKNETSNEDILNKLHLLKLKLDRVHGNAVYVLMRRAEELGIESDLIWKSANYCRGLLDNNPDQYDSRDLMAATWPRCLGKLLYELPSDIRQAILDGEAQVLRLNIKGNVKGAVKHVDPGDRASAETTRQQNLKARDKQIKLLCKTHKLNGEWVRLADVANDDPTIKQLGLKPITKHIARNVMIPPQRRLKK